MEKFLVILVSVLILEQAIGFTINEGPASIILTSGALPFKNLFSIFRGNQIQFGGSQPRSLSSSGSESGSFSSGGSSSKSASRSVAFNSLPSSSSGPLIFDQLFNRNNVAFSQSKAVSSSGNSQSFSTSESFSGSGLSQPKPLQENRGDYRAYIDVRSGDHFNANPNRNFAFSKSQSASSSDSFSQSKSGSTSFGGEGIFTGGTEIFPISNAHVTESKSESISGSLNHNGNEASFASMNAGSVATSILPIMDTKLFNEGIVQSQSESGAFRNGNSGSFSTSNSGSAASNGLLSNVNSGFSSSQADASTGFDKSESGSQSFSSGNGGLFPAAGDRLLNNGNNQNGGSLSTSKSESVAFNNENGETFTSSNSGSFSSVPFNGLPVGSMSESAVFQNSGSNNGLLSNENASFGGTQVGPSVFNKQHGESLSNSQFESTAFTNENGKSFTGINSESLSNGGFGTSQAASSMSGSNIESASQSLAVINQGLVGSTSGSLTNNIFLNSGNDLGTFSGSGSKSATEVSSADGILQEHNAGSFSITGSGNQDTTSAGSTSGSISDVVAFNNDYSPSAFNNAFVQHAPVSQSSSLPFDRRHEDFQKQSTNRFSKSESSSGSVAYNHGNLGHLERDNPGFLNIGNVAFSKSQSASSSSGSSFSESKSESFSSSF